MQKTFQLHIHGQIIQVLCRFISCVLEKKYEYMYLISALSANCNTLLTSKFNMSPLLQEWVQWPMAKKGSYQSTLAIPSTSPGEFEILGFAFWAFYHRLSCTAVPQKASVWDSILSSWYTYFMHACPWKKQWLYICANWIIIDQRACSPLLQLDLYRMLFWYLSTSNCQSVSYMRCAKT